MIYAIVKDGTVVNLVVWDGVSEWNPPDNCIAVQIAEGEQYGIGMIYREDETPRFIEAGA